MAERVLDLAEVSERGEVAGESMNAWLLATFPFTTPYFKITAPWGTYPKWPRGFTSVAISSQAILLSRHVLHRATWYPVERR